jgi:protein-S-isoprenylcysteine O-methyltransferase Ste14
VVVACALSLLAFGLSILIVERLGRRSARVEREAGPLALVNYLGHRSLGRSFSSETEVRQDTVLVTNGAFGLVRHPTYLSVPLRV